MIFPQSMTQVRLIIPGKDLMDVTRELARSGVFHQVEEELPGAEKRTATSMNTWAERAAAYANLERRILGIMQVLHITPGSSHAGNPVAVVDIDQLQPQVDEIDGEVKRFRDEINAEQKRIETLQEIVTQLEPIAQVDIDLVALRKPEYLYSIIGSMPVANIDRLQESLARIPFVFVPIRQDNQRAVVYLAGQKRNAEIVDRAARSAYLNPLSIPEEYQGAPEQILRALQRDIKAIQGEIAKQNQALEQIRLNRSNQLQMLLQKARTSRILTEAIGRYGKSRYTYLIAGWVPTREAVGFADQMKQVSPGILIETNAFRRGVSEQDVPVSLKNPGILRSFQGFVLNYANPRYNEIDPTILIGLTFPILFGVMFGDVGQGIILALLGALLSSRRIKALRGMAGLGGVILACGVVAAIVGFLYGSVFGFEDILPAIVFHPINNILATMALAIGLGAVVLSIGFLINILNSLVIRDWGKFLFDPHGIAGLLLYWSLAGVAVEVISGKHPIPYGVFGLLALLGGVGVMFSEALEELVNHHKIAFEGGLGMYVVQSFFELFEVLISLLSNSVSFVRLGAFAVAHGGLTAVFFILGQLISPGHGLGYGVVLIIGNLFIIGFEGLIVGIQTMRLEYYEFFSKFFAGGGTRYEPLTLEPKGNE